MNFGTLRTPNKNIGPKNRLRCYDILRLPLHVHKNNCRRNNFNNLTDGGAISPADCRIFS